MDAIQALRDDGDGVLSLEQLTPLVLTSSRLVHAQSETLLRIRDAVLELDFRLAGVEKLEEGQNHLDAKVTELRADTKTGFQEMDRRFTAVDARFDAVDARFTAVDARFDDVDRRFAAVDARFDDVDRRFDEVDAKFHALDAKFEAKFEAMDAKFEAKFDMVDERFSTMEAQLRAIAVAVNAGPPEGASAGLGC